MFLQETKPFGLSSQAGLPTKNLRRLAGVDAA